MNAEARALAAASRISLDGTWEFLHVSDDRLPGPAEVRSIQVPGPWQAQFDDLRMRAGLGIYRRTIEIPEEWKQDRIWLRFGAVFHNTKVWVNEELVGSNEGGFLPFGFDVTDALKPGSNDIKARVDSPTDNPAEYPDSPFAEIPFGKQSWYGPLSGIWQSVFLERRIADHIARLRLEPDRDSGIVNVSVLFAAPVQAPTTLAVEIRGGNDALPESWRIDVPAGVSHRFECRVARVRSWSPEAPHLYRIRVAMCRAGEEQDAVVEHFGFRKFESRDGVLYLNDEPLYLRAALDQDYYPGTICTVPSVAFLEDQFTKAKALGLNCLRCHIKAADPRYYEVADRMGLLIWTELPNGGMTTERSRGRKEKLLKGIVDRDFNHPSIVIWTIINENWGVDLVNDADHRAWLKRTYGWLKDYDRTRLVVDNSPLAPSFHVQTDIADYHFYAGCPDHRAAFDKFVDGLADREPWLYSPHGDAVVTGKEPLMCSEFGNWGLPFPSDLRGDDGKEPWWFETGHDWGEGVMYAHGVENRFADWSLGRVFGDLRGFVTAAQWQQFRALKYQIESMRRKRPLAGYVITELHDCHWESNGLLDMKRNHRVFHEQFPMINADTVVVPKWERLSCWSGEPASFDLTIAHGAGGTLDGARLLVRFGEAQRQLNLPTITAPQVLRLGTVMMTVPETGDPKLHRVNFEVRAADDRLVAENFLDVAVYPPREERHGSGERLWSPARDISERLHALGYRTVAKLDDSTVVVSDTHDDAIAAHVRGGARLLLLPSSETSLYPFFPHWQNVKALARRGTLWMGDWASSFAWLRRSPPFECFPGGPLLDETFDRIIPEYVIAGCNLLDFQARVFSGMVVGWVHKPVALGVERGYGRGRMAASCFRLFRDAPLEDPTATLMLDRLIGLLTAAHASSRDRADQSSDLAA